MSGVRLSGVRLDAVEVDRVAAFWSGVLDGRSESRPGGFTAVAAGDGASFPILITPAETPKRGQNRIHLDLTSSSPAAMRATVERALALGGRRTDVGQSASDRHVVLADPEDNELCVIEPGNDFLAGTGAIGAVNCDGTQAVGYFWHRVLEWPLVWDQDEETAIQSPDGGPKITWSGPPLMPRLGRDRLRLELTTDEDLDAALGRLRALGAVERDRVGGGGGLVLLDPDGNELHLVPSSAGG